MNFAYFAWQNRLSNIPNQILLTKNENELCLFHMPKQIKQQSKSKTLFNIWLQYLNVINNTGVLGFWGFGLGVLGSLAGDQSQTVMNLTLRTCLHSVNLVFILRILSPFWKFVSPFWEFGNPFLEFEPSLSGIHKLMGILNSVNAQPEEFSLKSPSQAKTFQFTKIPPGWSNIEQNIKFPLKHIPFNVG